MACAADRIVASPFAAIGSIGVISETPNAYERLAREGIQFSTVTAGEFKRTLTPTKKIDKKDVEKAEEDIAKIYTLFRDFVAKNRPKLDMDVVATGEVWFDTDAVEKGLVDEIMTKDDLLLQYLDDGFDLLQLSYEEPKAKFSKLQDLKFGSGSEGGERGGDCAKPVTGSRWPI